MANAHAAGDSLLRVASSFLFGCLLPSHLSVPYPPPSSSADIPTAVFLHHLCCVISVGCHLWRCSVPLWGAARFYSISKRSFAQQCSLEPPVFSSTLHGFVLCTQFVQLQVLRATQSASRSVVCVVRRGCRKRMSLLSSRPDYTRSSPRFTRS